jgi:hypothetical protein
MEEPGDVPLPGFADDGFEPVGLSRLLAPVAAEEQRIEPDQTIVLDILDPPVRAEIFAPALESFVVDRLKAVAGIADIVVARDGAKTYPKGEHQAGAML